jgi:hypothetical protein
MVKHLFVRALVAITVVLPSIAAAQTGKGYLFKAPDASVTMRAGYDIQNTSSQPFTVMRTQTTAGPRSFDAFNLGFDLNTFVSARSDLVISLDFSSRATNNSYTGGWTENGRPISHTSSLDRAAFGLGFRYNLIDRGRQISKLAFIPAKTLPYVGGTVGALWYDFTQKGDFLEVTSDTTADIFTDELESEHVGLMGQLYAGVERRLNARWSIVGESRYTASQAKLVADYADLEHINLSGLAFNVGATIRF